MQNERPRNRLVVKPSLLGRLIMWVVIGCGLMLILGAFGAAEEEGLAAATFVAIGGMFFVVSGAAHVLSRAIVTVDDVTYWNLFRRRIPTSTISRIRVDKGSGANYPRLAIWIDRTDSKPVRLTALQRPDSSQHRLALEQVAQTMASIVGIPGPADPGQ